MKTRPEEPLSICFKKTTLWVVVDAWSTAVMVEAAETADDGGGVDLHDICALLIIDIAKFQHQHFAIKTFFPHNSRSRHFGDHSKLFRKSSGGTFCEIQTTFLCNIWQQIGLG